MMVYDKPPFAIAGRKSLGTSSPKDLEGKILGAPPPDGHGLNFLHLHPQIILMLIKLRLNLLALS